MIKGFRRSAKFLPYQLEYMQSLEKFTAFVGGFGVGKSVADVGRCLHIMQERRKRNERAVIAFLAPNYGLLRDVNILKTEEFLQEKKIRYTINKSSNILKIPAFGGEIWFRSMHHPETIVGFDASDVILDEFDVIERNKQDVVWTKVIARLRKYKNSTLAISTTPEGYKKTYELFVKEKVGKLMQIDTRQNIFLPEDYIESLESQYDAELLEQYLKGQFVNIAGLRAYYSFIRNRNVVKEIPNIADTTSIIHIGIDFNVDPMCAVISKIQPNKKMIIFNEIIMRNANTYRMTELINGMYPKHQKFYYPDMTGGARKTSAVATDIQIIQKSGGKVLGTRNKYVRDSLNIINKTLQDVNVVITENCKHLIRDLEQVVRTQYGDIDKSDPSLTHSSDASRYLIDRNFSVKAKAKAVFSGM